MKIEINEYMNKGIKKLVGNMIKASVSNPRTALFMLKMQKVIANAQKKREKHQKEGTQVPIFLISSITEKCNLFCQGCYARSGGICGSGEDNTALLTSSDWKKIFDEAVDAGISFNILAGGEPLLRKDVITTAAGQKNMIFAIFTNGTLIDKEYTGMFAKNPNLAPILSLEGFQQETDNRRGEGVYATLKEAMRQLKANKILFGVSVTVNSSNMQTVTSPVFIDNLQEAGCKLIFFVEYVPVEKGTEGLVLNESHKQELENIIDRYKEEYEDMIFVSFPGDEKYMGGCLAAGRGFFHINPRGEAEACPFSPYSDRNLKQYSLLESLHSPFFEKLRETGLVGGEHTGGCVLFEREDEVKQMLG